LAKRRARQPLMVVISAATLKCAPRTFIATLSAPYGTAERTVAVKERIIEMLVRTMNEYDQKRLRLICASRNVKNEEEKRPIASAPKQKYRGKRRLKGATSVVIASMEWDARDRGGVVVSRKFESVFDVV
jgi:hypothetical protein